MHCIKMGVRVCVQNYGITRSKTERAFDHLTNPTAPPDESTQQPTPEEGPHLHKGHLQNPQLTSHSLGRVWITSFE